MGGEVQFGIVRGVIKNLRGQGTLWLLPIGFTGVYFGKIVF